MSKEVKRLEIMLVVLLIGALAFAFNVQQIKATSTVDGGTCTVAIRADGSVDPATAPIQRDGNIYTLTGNITCHAYSDGIVIERNNTVLDGAGYTLRGISGSDAVGGATSGRGITVSDRSNVTIRNLTITTFSWGIIISCSSKNNSILGITITNTDNIGLSLDHTSNNTITRSTITNSNLGILVVSSSHNSIYHNNFIFNNRQVEATTPSYANSWDAGYPTGGNYWRDYNGNDTCSGLYQNVSDGSDGIGDRPYIIDERNQDLYPLMTDPPFDPPADPTDTTNPTNPTENPSLGGTQIPVNKLELLIPYISLVSASIVATAAIAMYAEHERKRKLG